MIPFAPGEVDGLADVWLDRTVTLESPTGGDWQTEATGVPAGIQSTTTGQLSAGVIDQRSAGGLLEFQRTMLLIRKEVTIADNWRVTDETTGLRYVTGQPIRNPNAAPLLKVILKAAS